MGTTDVLQFGTGVGFTFRDTVNGRGEKKKKKHHTHTPHT